MEVPMSSIWVDLLGAEVRYRGRDFRTRTIEALAVFGADVSAHRSGRCVGRDALAGLP